MKKFAFDHNNKRTKIICLVLALAFTLVFCLFYDTSFAVGSEDAAKTAAVESQAPSTETAPADTAQNKTETTPAATAEDNTVPAATETAPASPAPSDTAPAATEAAPASPAPSDTAPAATETAPAATAQDNTAPATTETAPANTDQNNAEPSAAPTATNEPISDNTPVMTEQTIEADANGYHVSISGMMPEGSKIQLTAAGSGVAEKVADATGTEGDAVFAYDIKIIGADGAEWQPEELKVNVSISGLDLDKGDKVTMLHVLDDPAATEKAVASGDATMISGKEIGEKDKVAVTTPSVSVNTDKGVVNFSTDSFSMFIIVTGTTGNASGTGTMAVDTTLTLNGSNWSNSSWSISSSNPIVSGKTVVTITSTGNSSAKIQANNAGTAVIKHSKGSNSETWTITVTDQIGTMLQAINAVNNNPFVLAVLDPGATTLPGEPGISNNDYYFMSSLSPVSGSLNSGSQLDSSAKNYISNSIYTSAYVQGSVDGTNTYGVVDTTGVKTKALLLLTDTNWNAVRDFICSKVGYNSSEYEIIPYVIKLQMSNDKKWHVDCRLAKKANVSLTYDLNLASGVTVKGIQTPSGQTGVTGSSWTVAHSITIGSNSYTLTAGSTQITSDQNYKLTFQGWKDQNGNSYTAGTAYNFTQNTVLSAQWTYSPGINTGYVNIKKLVTTGAGSSGTAPAGDTFNFTVTFGQSGTYSYTIYNAAGSPVGSPVSFTGTSGSFSLSANQFAQFQISAGITYSVTEAQKDNYTPSWSNQNGTVVGGSTYNAVCTNTYGIYSYHVYYIVDGTQKYDDSYNYNAPLTIRGNESKSGYDFSGWTLHQGSATGTVIATAPSTMPNYNIYAVGTFTIKTYTIHYHVDRAGSSDYASQTFTVNNATITLTARKNDGVSYTLHGWYTNTGYTSQLGDPGSSQTFAALVALDTNNDKSIDLYGYTTNKLTVNKTGGRSGDTFIFNITGSDGTSGSFTITGNSSVVLTARYGVNYTVTEKSGAGSWSWRYAAVGSHSSGTVTGDSSMTINNSYSNDHWLGGVTHVLNKLLGITPSAS